MAALAPARTPATPMSRAASSSAAPRAHNIWAIALTVTMATFMELLDTSISNVSLPHIAGGLGTSYDESTWILTSYLVANAVILPMSAWLSRVFGRKRYYMMSVALFTTTSFLCGLAPSLDNADCVPHPAGDRRRRPGPGRTGDTGRHLSRRRSAAAAFALYSMAIVTAPAIGPPLGGWITDSFSWRWVFFINVPIGLLSLLLSSRLVHDPPEFTQERREARRGGKLRIDYIGIVLIAIGFACLEVVLDRGERDDWLGSHFIISFSRNRAWSRSPSRSGGNGITEDPVVELTLLRERNFAIANVLLLSVRLRPVRQHRADSGDASDAVRLYRHGRGVGAGSRRRGDHFARALRGSDRSAARRQAAARRRVSLSPRFQCSITAGLTSQTDYFHFALARVFQGFGYAFMFVPVSQLAYSYLPRNKNNKGSSLTNLCRNWGGSFGIAFVTTMLERRTQYHQSVLVSNITSADATVQQFVEQFEPIPDDSWNQRSRCDPPSLWTGCKPDDPAGDVAGIHGLLSPVGTGGDSGPAAGVPDSTFPDRRRRRSCATKAMKG